MSERRGLRVAPAAALCALLVVGLGLGGFALGRAGRTPEALARADERVARTHAYAVAYERAFRAGREQGREQGVRDGEARGAAAGGRLGQLQGEAEAARAATRRIGRRHAAGA